MRPREVSRHAMILAVTVVAGVVLIRLFWSIEILAVMTGFGVFAFCAGYAKGLVDDWLLRRKVARL